MAKKRTIKVDKNALLETGKFVLRIAILLLAPLLVQEAANFTGFWKTLFDSVLPVVLPIADKFVHESDLFKAKGIVPF